MSAWLTRGFVVVGLGLTLSMCSEDGTKQVRSAGGEGGEAHAGEGPVSGGSTAQPTAGSGGMPDVEAGGAAGAPTSSGAGGVMTTAGSPGEAGAAGMPGAAGSPSCEATSCCPVDAQLCTAGWDANCATSEDCCDPVLGVSRSCGYGGGGIDYSADVCVNNCTSKSYGTQSCSECLGQDDPSCYDMWTESCAGEKIYCSDPVVGYRKSCVEVGPYDRTIDVECVCDPDL